MVSFWRRMMDSGEIDFYRHNHMCSNTCRSTKFNVLTNGPRPSMGTPMQPGSSCVAPQPSGGQVPPMTGRLCLAWTVCCFYDTLWIDTFATLWKSSCPPMMQQRGVWRTRAEQQQAGVVVCHGLYISQHPVGILSRERELTHLVSIHWSFSGNI